MEAGPNVALLNGLCHRLIENGTIDRAFIATHTVRFDRFRVSKLSAIGRVLHPLAGLEPDLPTPAAERAVIVPAMIPTPGPGASERRGTRKIDTPEGPEGEYVNSLFSPHRVWGAW